MSIDHRVREVSSASPRLRQDVRTHYREFRGKPSYIVEDTSRGKFYHLGFPEHQFIQCLDGHTTMARALAENAATQGEDALTEKQADQLVRWLIDNDLLESDSSDQAERRREQWWRKKDKAKKNFLSKLFFFKIPLGCPDRLLKRLLPWMGWIFSVPGLILWFVLMSYAGVELGRNWRPFVEGAGSVIDVDNWWRIAMIYAVLKVLHEMGHGLATRRYGGEVPEWGVQMLVFVTPLAYVDASASWRFPSKWHRIIVSSAGMYVELAIAAACVIAWVRTDAGPLHSALHSAIFAASTITVLFNANPLMRFDGYHILVDLLGIPNLGTKGQQFLKWLGKRFFLGMDDLPLSMDVKQHPIAIPLYGILAALWKVVIWIGITIMVSLLAKGAGLVLAIASTVILILGGLYTFIKFLILGSGGQKPKLSKVALRLGTLILIVGGLLWFWRIDPSGRGVAVVEFSEKETVRAGCDGLVESVEVKDGQMVEKGQLLMVLSNPDEETERDQLRLEIGETDIRARRYFQEGKLAAYQAEMETLDGLQRKLKEKEDYLAFLHLSATVSGRVVGRNLDSLEGEWCRVGRKFFDIVPNKEKELLISFRQKDIESLSKRDGDEIRVRLRGRDDELQGKLTRVEARATRAVPHEVLVGPNGGPLPLRTRADPLSERERGIARGGAAGGGYDADLDYFSDLDEQHQSQQELAQPRFAARAELSDDAGKDVLSSLNEGEWGYVRLEHADRERLGVWLYQEISDYIHTKIRRATSGV